MTDPTQVKQSIARYAFLTTIGGALVLLVAALGMYASTQEMVSRILAWVALLGSIAMFGGLIVFIGHVIITMVQRRWE